MIKRLLELNDSSFIYVCNITQFREYVKDSNLTKEQLEQLKNKLEDHNEKSFVFIDIVSKQLKKK